MKKEGLGYLILPGLNEGKRNRGKQRVSYLTNLYEWMAENVQRGLLKSEKILRTTKDRKLYRAMITHILKERGT